MTQHPNPCEEMLEKMDELIRILSQPWTGTTGKRANTPSDGPVIYNEASPFPTDDDGGIGLNYAESFIWDQSGIGMNSLAIAPADAEITFKPSLSESFLEVLKAHSPGESEEQSTLSIAEIVRLTGETEYEVRAEMMNLAAANLIQVNFNTGPDGVTE